MATNYNASIVRSSLVMYYDMNNTQKSWLGAPTTNLTPNLGIVAIASSHTITYVGVENGWKKYSIDGTWTSGTYPYSIGVDSVTFTGGVTYTTGIYIKTNVPTKFAALFTGMNYVNQPMNNAGTSFSITQSDGSIFVGRSGFQYTSTTVQTGYLVSQPVVSQVFNGATDFIYIKQGQIEVGSFATPFVAGTRSNTQAIVDLAGNNTLTATSLTYNSDNTFSFNGTSDYIACGNLGTFYPQGTVSFWMNSAAIASYPNPFATHFQGGNAGFRFEGRSDGNFTMVVGNDAGTYTAHTFISSGMQANTWYNITFVWNVPSNNVVGYLNGVQVFNESQTYWATTMPGVTIGNGFSSSRYWNGKISATQIYNRSLSATEVAQNFNALRGRYGI